MRITRVRRSATAGPSEQELQALMCEIEDAGALQDEIDFKQKGIQVRLRDIQQKMTRYKLSTVAAGEYTGVITRSQGRESTVVDPRVLRKRLRSDDEFYACVKVSITETRKYLGEKELDGIGEKIPASLGEPALKIVQSSKVRTRRP